MAIADVSDDEISLTSTVQSEQQSEYEVETILAELESSGGVKYLVQWAGYSLERCTWEPAESFTADQTLLEWEEKKQEIAEGRQPAFDVASWEAGLLQIEAERAARKDRRRAKRRRFGLSDAVARSPDKEPDPQTSNQLLGQVHPSRLGQIVRPGANQPRMLFGTSQPTLGPSRPKKSQNNDSHKLFNLSTKWRYEKSKRDEPPPNINQLELIRPSEWDTVSPVNTASLGPHRQDSLNADEIDQVTKDQSKNPSTNDASTLLKAFQTAPDAPTVDPSSEPSRSHNSIKVQLPEKNIHLQNSPNAFNNPPKIPPRKQFQNSKTAKGLPNRFWQHGQVFVSMYYGPDKKMIGHARLCGLNSFSRKAILKSKVNHEVEIWFEHFCSLEEYHALCCGAKNSKYGNGWVEGFDDTEPEIYNLATTLEQNSLVAICYLNTDTQDVLLAYPLQSPSFEFLGKSDLEGSFTFLNIAIRGSLNPIKSLEPRRRSSPFTPSRMREPAPSTSSNHIQGNIEHSPSQSEDRNSNHLSKTPVPSAQGSDLDKQLSPHTNMVHGSQMEVDMDSSRLPTANQNSLIDLDTIFKEKFGITYETLATPNSNDKKQRADVFYLWFPETSDLVKSERELTMQFLRSRTALVYSNRVEEDWERFVSTCKKNIQGVILFHESFVDYHSIPSLRELLRRTSSYWNVSLSKPLQHVDGPVHFQRLFPHGCVILITEDFMRFDPHATLVILTWFSDLVKKKFPGNWKLMFRPDVLNWLLEQQENKDKHIPGSWLTMYHLIMKLGAPRTPSEALSGIMDIDCMSNIVCPTSIPGYGSHTRETHPDIPKDATQEMKDADRLAEFFAGWGLVNCHRFRRFVILTFLPPQKRWGQWEHVEVRHGAKDFMSSFNVDHQACWAKLRGRSKSLSINAEATPYTPRTPRAPAGDRHASQPRPLPHTLGPVYPQPYQ